MDIDVRCKYGVVANSTDNATALMQMRGELAGKGKPIYEIHLPPGEIRYSNNRWLFGIQRFRLHGHGATLKTIYSGSDVAAGQSIFVGNMFMTNVLTYSGGKTYAAMHLFNTVAAGSDSITCTAGDAANYAVGNRVILFGFDNTGFGYPPPTRSEWKIVKSINAGVITFDTPLEQSWNSGWWDVPTATFGPGTAVGKPRIVNLDRSAGQYVRYAEFNDLTFGRSTNNLIGTGTLVFPAEQSIVNNCVAEDFCWPSESIITKLNRVTINELTEFDKLVGNVFVTNSKFKKQVTGGSNCRNITVEDSQAAEAFQVDCSGHLIVRNTSIRSNSLPDTFAAAFSSQGAHNPIERITIDRLKFSSGPSSQSTAHIDKTAFNTLVIAAVSGTNIIIADTASSNIPPLAVRSMKEGWTVIFKDDGTKGGLVTSLTYDASYNSGAGGFVIAGDWAAPVAAETWAWCYVNVLEDLGGHQVFDGKFLFDASTLRWAGNQNLKPPFEMHLTQDDFLYTGGRERQTPFYGRIISVECIVTKAYSGSDSAAKAEIATLPGFATVLTLNLKTAGRRFFDQFGAFPSSPISGDTYGTATLGIWQKSIDILTNGSSGGIANLTAATKPKFEIVVRWMPF